MTRLEMLDQAGKAVDRMKVIASFQNDGWNAHTILGPVPLPPGMVGPLVAEYEGLRQNIVTLAGQSEPMVVPQ